MSAIRFVVITLAFLSLQQANGKVTDGMSGKLRLSVNPIRRVVTMLQSMQKKVAEEGEKEEALFEKFMCYFKNGRGSLESSIASAKNNNEQVASASRRLTQL